MTTRNLAKWQLEVTRAHHQCLTYLLDWEKNKVHNLTSQDVWLVVLIKTVINSPTFAHFATLYHIVTTDCRTHLTDTKLYFPFSWMSLASQWPCLCFVHRLDSSGSGRRACSSSRWVKTTHCSRFLDLSIGCCDSDALPRIALLQRMTSPATVGPFGVSVKDWYTGWPRSDFT